MNGITRFDQQREATQQRIADQLERIADALDKFMDNLEALFLMIEEQAKAKEQ